MKIICLLFCALALLMSSCTPTNEDKAQKLIKDKLKETLYHPRSYAPVLTKVDSSTIDVTTIEPLIQACAEIKDCLHNIYKCKKDIKESEYEISMYEMWPGRASNLQDAREKKERTQSRLDKYNRKLHKNVSLLKDNADKCDSGEFKGWIVVHSYQALNLEGSHTVTEGQVFFCDPEFSSCSKGYEANILEEIFYAVENVSEASSYDEIVDYFREDDLYYDRMDFYQELGKVRRDRNSLH